MQSFLRDRRGSAAVETAVLLPAYCLIIVMIIGFGVLLWSMSTVDYAVIEAARCGAVDTQNCGTTAAIQALAAKRAMNLVPANGFTVSGTTAPVCVSASYTSSLLPMTFSFNACHP